jgi:lipopolysaccharide/colanic/teichoic acid biosynthesis glycosyltransferase
MIQRLLALVLLVFLSPAMGLLYVLVKLDSKGPFVFRQKRLGENKRPFSLYKIRTMKVGSQTEQNKLRSLNQADGPVFKIHDDPRFTRAGRLISHTGLDELLQLINIIKGEMAFVGPRPLPKKEADKIAKKYQRRFMVLPGITSLWVVRGAQHQDFASWMKDDLEYINNKSLKLDLVIIIKSIKMLILMLWRQLIKN